MSAGVSQSYLFLCVLVSMTIPVRGCPFGWFGRGCNFQCHCSNGTACDVNGECPNHKGSCASGYFGPGCQYVDLIVTEVAPLTPLYLRDELDSTCNPNKSATSVQLFLRKALPFSWYRVVVNSNRSLLNITTTFSNGVRCLREMIYSVSSMSLDVWCHLGGMLISNFTVKGAVAGSICTVRVSGGRNVALKQAASQSSTYRHHISQVQASNAVDGNTQSDYAQFSCSRTGEAYKPSWELTFTLPYWIPRIIIYSVDDPDQHQYNLMLETYDVFNNKTKWHRAITGLSAIVDVIIDSREPVRRLKVTRMDTPRSLNLSLYLCEVQAMGEAACPWQMYGIECEKTCTCEHDVWCSVVTGACTLKGPRHTCPDGTYGDICSWSCGPHCQYGICVPETGDCLTCIPGYTGRNCDQACAAGTFGPACRLNCSQHCANTCHNAVGICQCKEGYQGTLCTECLYGLYGDNCSKTCSPFCVDSLCHILTGECMACVEGHTGRFCEDCQKGYYGVSCNVTCPKKCQMGGCNIKTGQCNTCQSGYSGAMCTISVARQSLHAGFLLTLVFPCLLMAIWLFVGQSRRASTSLDDE